MTNSGLTSSFSELQRTNPPRPNLVGKHAARKRLLVLSSRAPFGARSGDSIRLLHIARALSADYELTLLCFSEDSPETCRETASEEERQLFSEVHVVRLPRWQSYLQTLLAVPTSTPLQLAYYRSKRFQQAVRTLLPEHDGVVAHLQRTGQYVDTLAGAKPVLLEMTDAISLTYKRAKGIDKKREWLGLVYALEQKRLAKLERAAPARFSETWLVSPVDVEYLFGQAAPSTVACAPLPVDLSEYPYQSHVSGNTVLFIGNMRSVPNRDACLWFCSEVLPALLIHNPSLRFRIIGPADSETRTQLNAIPGVEALGAVGRIREHIEDVFCGVCPVRMGAGMQNKVLNYLALGLPCVTSEIGLEGIRATHGNEVLCFRTAAEAIEQISLLAGAPTFRDGLRVRGLSVARAYSTEAVYPYMQARAWAVFSGKQTALSRDSLDTSLRAEPWMYGGGALGREASNANPARPALG